MKEELSGVLVLLQAPGMEVAIAELIVLQPEEFPPLTVDVSTWIKKGLPQRLKRKGKGGQCSSQSYCNPFETPSKADQGCKLDQARGVTTVFWEVK